MTPQEIFLWCAGTYFVVYLGIWIVIGYRDDWNLSDADEAIGAFFLTLFWPIILVCGIIYLFFKGLIGIGRLLRYVPKLWAKAVVAYYKWKHS